MDKNYISAIAGVVFVIGFIPYIVAILKRETKPSKASWLIWLSLDIIALAGMYEAGTVNGQIIGAVAGAGIVATLSFVYGVRGWTRLDIYSLSGAVLAIVLWQLFKNPVLGIVVSGLVAILGSIPTFVSAWKKPANENRTAWTIFSLSCVLQLIAVPSWALADAAQPLAFSTVEFTMMYILFVHGRKIQSV